MKILVKDDYGIYRKGICELIKDYFPGAHPEEADSTADLLKKIASTGCDLVIANFYTQFDGDAPELSLFKQKFPDIPVIVLGNDYLGIGIKNAPAREANQYLKRNCSLKDLAEAIDKAITGKVSLVIDPAKK